MNPLSVYQEALDAVSAAVLANDFEAYAARIDLPYLVTTDAARLVVATVEELRPTFDVLASTLRKRGVTHYERVARDAQYVSAVRIEGRHFTHLIAAGRHLARPHEARQALVRRDAVWRFTEASYPTRADRWPVPEHLLFPEPGRGADA